MGEPSKELSRHFPPCGPCAVCGHKDARHRTWDAIVERSAVGESVESLAADFGKPIEAIEMVLRERPYAAEETTTIVADIERYETLRRQAAEKAEEIRTWWFAERRRTGIFAEITAERERQDAKWGEQNHPSVDPVLTARDGGCDQVRLAEEYEIPTEGRAKQLCQHMESRGELTWGHIAVEELAEAVSASRDGTEDKTRGELVQLAAVVVQWIECIDRRAAR